MNTNQLKKFAKEARIKLITQIGVKLDFVLTQDTAELRGKSNELGQLRSKLSELGREQLIETVAYTWFNRIMALRFMDANGYNTPKVVTPLPGMSNPEILQNALAGNIEEDLKLDRQRLNDLIDGRTSSSDAQTEAFKMLLVASCNKWHSAMPFMFERISDYTELLLPDDLLSDFSIVSDIRIGMSDDDCQHEEILGWLYQFYISDENERLIKSKNVYKKHELAPASQLFTPKWIVKYMVDNTLGQLWSEINPTTTILSKLEYYIKPDYKDQLQTRTKKNIEEIKFFEPCVGSAHILSYAFDVFFLMYEEQGYSTSEIPELIIKNNLFGIDIDERAAQIASFVLIMKGRRKNSRLLRKNITPNITFYEDFSSDQKFDNCKALGSLIKIEPNEIKSIEIDEGSVFADNQRKLKKLYTFLGQRYDCVVTNAPYISSARMEASVKKYTELNYPDTKTDLFATFIIRCLELCNEDGLSGYMTPFVWMFISSYEKLRNIIIDKHFINNLVQLEYSGFDGATVPVCTFTLRNKALPDSKGCYIRLSDFKGSENQAPKTLEAIKNNTCGWFYKSDQYKFKNITGSPIAFSLSTNFLNTFNYSSIEEHGKVVLGMNSTNNELFVRFWFEVSKNNFNINCLSHEESIGNLKWFPYNKGGAFRRWYGNRTHVLNWKNKGEDIHHYNNIAFEHKGAPVRGKQYQFKESLSWSFVTSGNFGVRYSPPGSMFDVAGSSIFIDHNKIYSLLGFLNSKVATTILKVIAPTLNFQVGNIASLPIGNIFNPQIDALVKECISISKLDWDTNELSWDFEQSELLKFKTKSLKDSLGNFQSEWTDHFNNLLKKEVSINDKLIELYELKDDLNSNVSINDITILQEESKIENQILTIDSQTVLLQFISYSIGCIFGRYSVDQKGLILANQGDGLQEFIRQISSPTFMPDEDNIIPVLDDEWFNDDIVGRFKVFLKATFGSDQIENNLRFIEEIIEREIRKYLVKDFYNDHIKRYKKRPIYWMFTSPKGHFKALIYMHRYQPDLCSKMLNDYLQPFISKLEAAKQTNTLLALREDVTAREKTIALKEADRLVLMIRDCKDYERTLFTIATQKITIDLDDGVKVNYLKFKEVLVPIKGLEKEED
jgi:hypothetical protein